MTRCRKCGGRFDYTDSRDYSGTEGQMWEDLLDSVCHIDAQDLCNRCKHKLSLTNQLRHSNER
jgi:hypothetical protein